MALLLEVARVVSPCGAVPHERKRRTQTKHGKGGTPDNTGVFGWKTGDERDGLVLFYNLRTIEF